METKRWHPGPTPPPRSSDPAPRPPYRWTYRVANHLSLGALGISATALAGHISERLSFFTRWGTFTTEMGPNTAAALVLLSAAIYLTTMRKE